MGDEADREEMSQTMYAQARSGAARFTENLDISQSHRTSYMESAYGATEMSALYVDEAGNCLGEAYFNVIYVPGMQELTLKEYAQSIADGVSEALGGNSALSETSINGKNAYVIENPLSQYGVCIQYKTICMKKDAACCMIVITYLGDYEEIYTDFLNSIHVYS